MEKTKTHTAPALIDTDKKRSFNFLHIKKIFEKRRINSNKTNCISTQLVNLQKEVYSIEINHTKKTVKINNLFFNIIEGTDFVYNFNKRQKTVKTVDINYLEKHIISCCNPSDCFHHGFRNILKKLIN